MKTAPLYLLFLMTCFEAHSQYRFEGHIADNIQEKTVYLSIIEDYRKLTRPYLEQIIKKTEVDSLGFFKFEASNLSLDNRIYRIHIDACSSTATDSNHFFGRCENSKSILFIANNRDTLQFPSSFADEILCEITSTNKKSAAFLEIDVLKEKMAFDFFDFRSQANRKLNFKKWFSKLQAFGASLDEPLAELYIYDFLSDKRNETYTYYLTHIAENQYYQELLQRLEERYPNTAFTELYKTEISTDEQIKSNNQNYQAHWKWILTVLLTFSVLINLYFIYRQRKFAKEHQQQKLNTLTAQEQKIVTEILKDKSNKEIAATLFISLSTVKTHINNLYKKLNITSRYDIKRLFN